MYARLTTVSLASSQRDDTAEVLPQLMPTLRRLAGFRGMLVGTEGDGRRVVALTLWDSVEALEASTPTLDQIRDAEAVGREIDSKESAAFRVIAFEVAD